LAGSVGLVWLVFCAGRPLSGRVVILYSLPRGGVGSAVREVVWWRARFGVVGGCVVFGFVFCPSRMLRVLFGVLLLCEAVG